MADTPYRNGRDRTNFDPNVGAMGAAALGSAVPPAPDDVSTDGKLRVVVDDEGDVYLEETAPAVHIPSGGEDFYANLAETLPTGALSKVAEDYYQGVEQDIQSRAGFMENYNEGIDLLGLKIEKASASRGGQTSISKLKSPALLKACINSQATTCAELLPPGGPVRVQTVGGSTANDGELARDFASDFNYYLTDVAREFYPDTRRAMFYRAFGGSVYKKVYRCPLRRRPVSESVYLPDLIVSEDALDLSTAQRKTNEIVMNEAQLRRMQLMGGWADIEIPQPQTPKNTARLKEMSSMGISPTRNRAGDMPYTFWEGYVFVDPAEMGIPDESAPRGMPLPYRVVIDSQSRNVLAFHRNWKKDDEQFRERDMFVKYGLIPGLGFLDYGMLHLIGNSTRALTAILQIMVDKGMLNNFPAGVKIKGIRAATNEITPSLGEFVDLEVPDGVTDIRQAIMGLPYGDISTAFIQLMEVIKQDVNALAGTVEVEIGENRTNVPVGTMLAALESKALPMSSVHRADHQSQKEELRLLRNLFVENPGDLHWLTRKGGQEWRTVEEFMDLDLVPVSDPAVPSQMHRMIQNQFLAEIAERAPQWFGPNQGKVVSRVLRGAGINDADQYVLPPAAALQWQRMMSGGKASKGSGAAEKAQLELPLKAAQVANESKKIELQAAENQRQAANEAAQHVQRERKQADDTALAAEKLRDQRLKTAADLQGAQSPDPEAEASVLQKVASAYASMGSGAANFAKAGESVQQGEQDLAGLEDEELT